MSHRQNPGCGSKPTRRFLTHQLKPGRALAWALPRNPGCRFPGGSMWRTILTFQGKRLETGEDNFVEPCISKDAKCAFVEWNSIHDAESKTSMRPPTPQDQEAIEALIQRCLQGDQEAFAALYEVAAPGLYQLAYSILLHVQDAAYGVQESMVYVFNTLQRYQPERGAFRTWLYTITVSRCRNARRRKWLPTTALSHLLSLGLEPRAPDHHTPEAAGARMAAREALEKALATLSPRLREAIALRYGHGLTYL